MNNKIETFDISLITKAPLFIGSGKEISKKEYIFLSNKEIAVPNPEKLYLLMKQKSKAKAFENYMLDPREKLSGFLQTQRLGIRDIESSFEYKLQSDEIIDMKMRNLQIMEFVKDSYGKPYIPGSSVKGMLRTILLAYDIKKNPAKYRDVASSITNELNKSMYGKPNRNKLLSSDSLNLETIAFRKLANNEKKQSDAVNDILQGLIVSDSEPLDTTNLILCQRIELHKDGKETKLPVYRECIKPQTNISFSLTIDHDTCDYSKKDILEAIRMFIETYYDVVLSKYGMDRPSDDSVLLGGGVGFISKTVIYNLFDEQHGIQNTVKVFEKTGVSDKHKHYNDKNEGVSPHVLKCAQYGGKIYQIGLCELEFR